MDSLDHMLTDSLELGSSGEGNGTQIMEDCMLGSIRVSLPEDLLEDVSRNETHCNSFCLPPNIVKQEGELSKYCLELFERGGITRVYLTWKMEQAWFLYPYETHILLNFKPISLYPCGVYFTET